MFSPPRAVLGADPHATAAVASQLAGLPLSHDCRGKEMQALALQYLDNVQAYAA